MKSLLSVVLTSALLSACTVLPQPTAKSTMTDHATPLQLTASSEYAKNIASQLVRNANVNVKTISVGVTTLNGVTSNYDTGTPFAQALSQQLMTELHQQHLKVMDFKTADFIRVTNDGDFALTRDYMELDEILPITHVLVGTFSQHRSGVEVNARLVDINSKVVVSVAQTLIPEDVVRQLAESEEKATLRQAP